ncbi:hypothetical protein CANTEDRAFT_92110 [Yamadazyma tenuis ATCC 10573]|uniref:Zn(2)-C6 fungal-type domain-containing protein n=1 Tax=Candida tenuis (strain ATCC 10573 / BCRC 21748 / CBS 615 / JCM 9827 / NBRC 10315 / NRRL Y-1498 / VKM Y-70) TaxID=590646 RepID=G3AY64_CANTC|nr:uncharacterized protein CANTEDRAFT_92110 [Yamadazyma tenuis ATCC 10573]EGV65778.1 hypothetical protein CANTEDRAFT_92110 [Yamadazyma tenuis ATCC 10573]
MSNYSTVHPEGPNGVRSSHIQAHSFDSSPSPSADSSDTANHLNNKKHTRRSVACKNCHALKVKCVPSDPNSPASSCVRCLHTKKKCEINLNQPRKRRKKAEIEEMRLLEQQKLTSTTSVDTKLNTSQMSQDDGNLSRSSGGSHAETPLSNQTAHMKSLVAAVAIQTPITPSSEAPNAIAMAELHRQIMQLKTEVEYYKSRSRLITDERQYVSEADLKKELQVLACDSQSLLQQSVELKDWASHRRLMITDPNANIDVLSKGLISEQEAEERLRLYREQVHDRFPYFGFDGVSSAAQLAENSPFLFNSIMVVASVILTNADPIHCQRLDIEVTRELVTNLLIAGSKSDEILQGLVLLSFWFNSPELVRQKRFHLLNSLAISLLHDLGLLDREADIAPEVSLQRCKLIAVIYTSAVSTCLILRRSIYVRWTAHVERCCQILEAHPLVKVRNLSTCARLCRILERINTLVHNSESAVDDTTATLYMMSDFGEQLNEMKKKIDPGQHGTLSFFYAVEAYLHEPLLSQVAGVNEEDGHLFFKERAVTSITKSTTACINCLTEFSKLEIEHIASIPIMLTSRILFTAGILLRLRYLVLSVPLQIEKSVVPEDAISKIQSLNLMLMEASKAFPANFTLRKLSMTLQLFISVYSVQITNLLRSNDRLEGHNPDLEQYLMNAGKTLPLNHPHEELPLEVLSYAASLKKDLRGVNEMTKKLKLSSKGSLSSYSHSEDGKTPNSASPNQQGPDTSSAGPANIYPYPNSNGNGISANHRASAVGTQADGAATGLVGFEELDKSLYNFGDEFWGDIVDPISNNFNLDIKSMSSDVFSMS